MTRASERLWAGVVVVPAPRTAPDEVYAPPASTGRAPAPAPAPDPTRDWAALADAAVEQLDWAALTEAALERLLGFAPPGVEAAPDERPPAPGSAGADPSVGPRHGRVAHALATLLGAAVTTAAAVLFLGLAVLPRTGAYSTLTVLSGSMRPHIPAGSVVVDVPVRADRLAVGDVITFRAPRDGQPVITHRVHALERRGPALLIRTKGDANTDPDPWTIGIDDPATTSLDRVAFAVPYLGEGIAALRTPAARLALGWGAPALLCVVVVRRIWRRP